MLLGYEMKPGSWKKAPHWKWPSPRIKPTTVLLRGGSTSHCFYRLAQTDLNCLYFVINLCNNVESNRSHPDTVYQWTSTSSWGEFSGHHRSRLSERPWTEECHGWGLSALDRPQHLTMAGDHESESSLSAPLPLDGSRLRHLTTFSNTKTSAQWEQMGLESPADTLAHSAVLQRLEKIPKV